MALDYRVNAPLKAEELAALFRNSGIRRPDDDLPRIERMIENANLTVTAWDGARPVGVARALTDFSWCCYLSDLAVDRAYQRRGIGRELIRRVRAEAGDGTALVLVSAPSATEYYPRIGLDPIPSGWMIKRAR